MKVVVKLGYSIEFMLASHKEASSLMTLLEKAVVVRESLWKDKVEIRGQIRMELKSVPDNTEFVPPTEERQDPDVTPLRSKPIRRLSGKQPLLIDEKCS